MVGDPNLAARIPADLAEADDLLTRYGAWAADRTPRRRCGSAERDYQPTDRRAQEARREARPVGMPINLALCCQRALSRVPDRERIVLAVLYVPRRQPPEVQLRLLHIPPRLSRERHLAGLRMFDNLVRVLLHCAAPDTESAR